ncbi:AAA+ family ATPase [Synechococcus sp. PCC 7502]|uniref:AAA family ATPase n=1 Tax=Synechococcus sp. PCC 7502 TaxID=1173263 RepID=UPI00029FB163|nr:AAA family ATPase [Synechococcus sp. PCC 7502]AFY73365.1 AAA+ family ATPase [Synechococcus sp. PCC 7502]
MNNSSVSTLKLKFAEEFSLLVRAKYPIIYVLTEEEERAEKVIIQVAKECNPIREVFWYDLIKGFEHDGKAKSNFLQALEKVEQDSSTAIYVIRDLHHRLGEKKFDEQIVRQLRNLYKHLRGTRKTLVLLSPVLELPAELQEQITVINMPLPDSSEIRLAIKQAIPDVQIRLHDQEMNQLIKAALGLTRDRIINTLAKSIVQKQYITAADIDLVLAEKQQRIRQTEFLEFFTPQETLDHIGGLDNFKYWLVQRQLAFSDAARDFGLPHPKGVLLMGIQGTGKSLCAKAIAHLWNLPLLRLDVGKLFGSLLGQSESRTRQTIQQAEAISPCILWIDEIDKAFGGISGISMDSGTSQRVFATLLTWMQEKTSSVFIVATANNIHVLPPELLRKGRFDEIFFINLPNYEERKQILKVHLQRFRPDSVAFDLDAIAQITEDFSGAEIEQAIIEGMYSAFNQSRDLTTQDIVLAVKNTFPLASTAREQINYMKAWAEQGRARSACGVSNGTDITGITTSIS